MPPLAYFTNWRVHQFAVSSQMPPRQASKAKSRLPQSFYPLWNCHLHELLACFCCMLLHTKPAIWLYHSMMVVLRICHRCHFCCLIRRFFNSIFPLSLQNLGLIRNFVNQILELVSKLWVLLLLFQLFFEKFFTCIWDF